MSQMTVTAIATSLQPQSEGGQTRCRGGTAGWVIPGFLCWKVSGERDRDQPALLNCSVS